MIRDENHNVVGMLCINLDVSVMEKFNEFLQQFLQCAQFIAKPEPLFKDDWQERINTYIHHYLNEHQLLLDSLNRKEKKP